jgi:hypothetical protein
VPYTPGTGIGEWRPTPPANAPAAAPQWAGVTPWAMTSPSQFRDPNGPPDLNSAEYTAAFNQVKELGSATSTTRTADQSNIAQFWAGPPGTSGPPGHWNRIAQTVAQSQGNTLEENARMFALLGIAQADSRGRQRWEPRHGAGARLELVHHDAKPPQLLRRPRHAEWCVRSRAGRLFRHRQHHIYIRDRGFFAPG